MSDTYRVSTWDTEGGELEPVRTGLSLFAIRPVLLELYSWGWSPISVQVCAETHDREAKRHARGFCADARNPYPKKSAECWPSKAKFPSNKGART